jgi:Mlc titration factor MtfA (ptsG expression regulator)
MVTMWVLSLAALALIVGLLAQPWWQARQRERLAKQPFPASWRRILRHRVPWVARLPANRQLQLKARMKVFLAEVPFIGCAGLKVTQEMRVTIAAQACLLLLGRPEPMYERLHRVLLYPGAFVVPRTVPGPAGLQSEEQRVLSGESWGLGQVILSWQEVLHGAAQPADGRNVVIHEFAHQLDQANGPADAPANGAPRLAQPASREHWAAVMQAEFQALRRRSHAGEPGLLDPYGATEPAEFFAVASEVFFERPQALAQAHPALHGALQQVYGVNPAQW